jgi:hypothetical protein
VPGRDKLNDAAGPRIATAARGKRGRPISEDDLDIQNRPAATKKRHSIFQEATPKRVIQNSVSGESDDNGEAMKATGEEEKAKRSNEKSTKGIERYEDETAAISPIEQADRRKFLKRRIPSRSFDRRTSSRTLAIAWIEETIGKERETLEGKKKFLNEREKELHVRQESLERKQKEVNQGQDDIYTREGHLRALESLLKKFSVDQLDIA